MKQPCGPGLWGSHDLAEGRHAACPHTAPRGEARNHSGGKAPAPTGTNSLPSGLPPPSPSPSPSALAPSPSPTPLGLTPSSHTLRAPAPRPAHPPTDSPGLPLAGLPRAPLSRPAAIPSPGNGGRGGGREGARCTPGGVRGERAALSARSAARYGRAGPGRAGSGLPRPPWRAAPGDAPFALQEAPGWRRDRRT